MVSIAELIECLNSNDCDEPYIHHICVLPESNSFPESFEYDSQLLTVEERWKDYTDQKTFIVRIEDDTHLKVFLLELISKEIAPVYIVIVSSKDPEFLEEDGLLIEEELDDFVKDNDCQEPGVFFERYIDN